MKVESLGRIVVAVVLTSLFYACATDATKPAKTLEAEVLVTEEGEDPKGACKWKVTRVPSQKNKVKNVEFLTNPGKCTIATSTEFYIGTTSNSGMKVLDMEAKDFLLQGSCRRCYANTGGGMTCVTYPGC